MTEHAWRTRALRRWLAASAVGMAVVFALGLGSTGCRSTASGPGTATQMGDAGSYDPFACDANCVAIDAGAPFVACSAIAPWSVFPIDLAAVVAIRPLGQLTPPYHIFPVDHAYVQYDASAGPIDLRAPGAVRLVHASASEYLAGFRAGKKDVYLEFLVCQEETDGGSKDVTLAFGHVSSVSAPIEAVMADAGTCSIFDGGVETTRMCEAWVSRDFDAGEILGSLAGTTSGNLDLSLYDERNPNGFDPARYSEMTRTAACPLDYFEPTLRATLYNLLGDYLGAVWTQPVAEPRCGRVYLDVAGTAKGNWLRPGFGVADEWRHISLAHRNIDPRVGVFSIGTLDGVASGPYEFTPDSGATLVNRAFEQVTPGPDVHCYEVRRGDGAIVRFIVQLVSASSLKIEGQDDGGCGSSWAFGGRSEVFER